MQIIMWILIGGVSFLTILCCLYLTIAMPAILIWKIYRKVRYGMSIYD